MGLLGLVVLVVLVTLSCEINTGRWVHARSDLDFITWGDFSLREVEDQNGRSSADRVAGKRVVIVVAKDGTGDSTTVQGGVDLVPHGNNQRVKIIIRPGVYREKVVIPSNKPYISLIGEHSSQTVISWNTKASDRDAEGRTIGTLNSATVAVESSYFAAYGITFENTATLLPGSDGQQAVALRVTGDRCMFLRCSIKGSQDTLFDHMGRHYFRECYIEGSIDFIFGRGKSLYHRCIINATASKYGAIAASQRNEPGEDAGFSFLQCKIKGSGSVYLGRAWGRYATIVFLMCSFEDIINPQGWNDWGDPSRRGTVLFGEYESSGRGAISKGRVSWAKSLNQDQAKPYMGRDFIDGDFWLRL